MQVIFFIRYKFIWCSSVLTLKIFSLLNVWYHKTNYNGTKSPTQRDSVVCEGVRWSHEGHRDSHCLGSFCRLTQHLVDSVPSPSSSSWLQLHQQPSLLPHSGVSSSAETPSANPHKKITDHLSEISTLLTWKFAGNWDFSEVGWYGKLSWGLLFIEIASNLHAQTVETVATNRLIE